MTDPETHAMPSPESLRDLAALALSEAADAAFKYNSSERRPEAAQRAAATASYAESLLRIAAMLQPTPARQAPPPLPVPNSDDPQWGEVYEYDGKHFGIAHGSRNDTVAMLAIDGGGSVPVSCDFVRRYCVRVSPRPGAAP